MTKQPTTKTTMKSTRTVSFSPMAEVYGVLARTNMTQKEKDAYWWSRADQLVFRQEAQRIVVETRKNGRVLIQLIDKSLEIAQEIVLNLKPHHIDMILRDPTRYTAKLEKWSQQKDRRGLEKFTSPYHRQHRLPAVRGSRALVCEMFRVGVPPAEIAEIYAEQCRMSKVYSRMMGVADYRTAYGVEHASLLPKEVCVEHPVSEEVCV